MFCEPHMWATFHFAWEDSHKGLQPKRRAAVPVTNKGLIGQYTWVQIQSARFFHQLVGSGVPLWITVLRSPHVEPSPDIATLLPPIQTKQSPRNQVSPVKASGCRNLNQAAQFAARNRPHGVQDDWPRQNARSNTRLFVSRFANDPQQTTSRKCTCNIKRVLYRLCVICNKI